VISVASDVLPVRAQFLRFALVGCAGFVVDAGVLSLVLWLGADHYTGRIASYLAAATFTWALNRNYTFRAQRGTGLLSEWGRFLAANAVGGVINWATYAILVSFSATVFAHPVIGVAAGSLAGLVVNFTLSRRFVFGTEAGVRRVDWTLVALPLILLAVMLGSKVNPWPRDGWFETQYFLFGNYPGYDNYAPVSAPALLFGLGHVIAVALGLDLAGELYVGVVLQNLLILLSAYFVYLTLKAMRFTELAGPVAIGFLLCILSTNLPQAFYSESTVIFLMAAVMFVVVVLPEATGARFWKLTAVCSLLVGLLVLTRMTPVFLIPALALLFFRRMPLLRVVQFTGALTAITVVLLAATVLANHARFGRYELTNSSGRHLWQGVMELTDDPGLRGLNWWEVPPAGLTTLADPRDPVLASKAKEIIRKEPGRYLLQGAKKFATTIGVAPYYFGTGGSGGHTNPLQRTELLPSLSASSTYEAVVHGVMRRVYIAFSWAYPITIVVIAAAWIVRVARRERATGAPLISVYSFLALLFFGSLWFSWQVEIENSRNAIPYLPLWALMLAMTAGSLRLRARESR
jgi:putative flippase GtrA